MKAQLRSAGGHLAGLAWVAVRSFARTLLVLTFAGVLLGGLSYFFLREHHWSYGSLGFAAALVESVAVGVVLGGKRALAMALAHALGALRLGRALVRLIFERMLSLGEGGEVGERGGRITRGIERFPLAKAEDLLSRSVRAVTGEIGQGGWGRRMVQECLLETVRKYTLARFRQEGTQQGGIDLLKLKDELEETIDGALIQKVRAGLWTPMVLAMIGLPILVATQTWLIVSFAAGKSL